MAVRCLVYATRQRQQCIEWKKYSIKNMSNNSCENEISVPAAIWARLQTHGARETETAEEKWKKAAHKAFV